MFMYTASACKTKLATVFVYTLDGYSSLLQLYPSRSAYLAQVDINTQH